MIKLKRQILSMCLPFFYDYLDRIFDYFMIVVPHSGQNLLPWGISWPQLGHRFLAGVTGAPQFGQNFTPSGIEKPQFVQDCSCFAGSMEVPQFGQNLMPKGTSAWHPGQTAVNFVPQEEQNFCPFSLGTWQLGHRTCPSFNAWDAPMVTIALFPPVWINRSVKSKISSGSFFCPHAPMAAVTANGAKSTMPTVAAPALSIHFPEPTDTFSSSPVCMSCTWIAVSMPANFFQLSVCLA